MKIEKEYATTKEEEKEHDTARESFLNESPEETARRIQNVLQANHKYLPFGFAIGVHHPRYGTISASVGIGPDTRSEIASNLFASSIGDKIKAELKEEMRGEIKQAFTNLKRDL